MKKTLLYPVAIICAALAILAYHRHERNKIVPDAARLAGKQVQDFPESASRAFDEMDGGTALSPEETKGRNTWLLWTAGNESFWDKMAQKGEGIGDLLKAVDSRQRATRFQEGGLINQPGFSAAASPDRYGLWIDEGMQEEGVDPQVYGKPTGIVGLRLFPNPRFDQAAQSKWDAKRYYSDRAYFTDSNLTRPYIVGMTCGFCHVSFNPEHSPKNVENPQWSELSSAIGNQYLRAGRVFGAGATDDSFAMQVLRSWAPGTIDTSFLATDHINNPSKINPIFMLTARTTVAHPEHIGSSSMSLPGELREMAVPHILKDGADSVGVIGALSRVYVSIGEYSEEWLRDHDALLGATSQRPFSISRAQQGSVYWQATATKLNNVARFLSTISPPSLPSAAEDGIPSTTSRQELERGKIVFADNCAGCHSSKQPKPKLSRGSSGYKAWMREEVMRPDFLENNFLSNEDRIPVSVVRTNPARALATNAMRGHVWNDFSSETYKNQESAGYLEYVSTIDRSKQLFSLPAGGPGYYRVPSLRGIWATAPLLHNSALGQYNGNPSSVGRLKTFDDSMRKLLWPHLRTPNGLIARTSADSYLSISASSLPWGLRWLTRNGSLILGPIPQGTPVDLIASANIELSLDSQLPRKLKLLLDLRSMVRSAPGDQHTPQESQRKMKLLEADLLAISKCPEFIQDKGHTFGEQLPDADKEALLRFVKTF